MARLSRMAMFHIGTALNKILKEHHHQAPVTLRGNDAPYVPGWDCHGLPIEFKVTQDMRKAGATRAPTRSGYSQEPARPRPENLLTSSSERNSNASASWATGTIRT